VSCLPFSNGSSHTFPAPSCEKRTAGDSSIYRAWRLWYSQARRLQHLDMTKIPSTLQSQPVTMLLVHLALPVLNLLSYIRYKKARLQSDRLITIWHVSFCLPFLGLKNIQSQFYREIFYHILNSTKYLWYRYWIKLTFSTDSVISNLIYKMYRLLAYLNNKYTIDMKFTRKKFVLLETCLPLSNVDILLVPYSALI
jgi:hypothetical protein